MARGCGEDDLDFTALVRTLHETAMGIDALPIGGIRTRAARRENFQVADQHPDNGFINVTLRIARGRPIEVQKAAGEALFGALNDFVADALQSRPISLSYEIQEIDPETRWKHSNIREYMQKRQH